MPDVAADVFPLAWPGHDAWQDPGFGWTPPLTLPPLTGHGRGTDALGEREPVPERLTQPVAEREQHAVAGTSGAKGTPGEEQRGARPRHTVASPPWPNWQRQAT